MSPRRPDAESQTQVGRPAHISMRYELRRLQLCAREARGSILDLGHAQLPNPYLPGSSTVGLDLDLPLLPSGYAEDIRGSVLELGALLGGRRFDTIIAGELIEHLERPYDFLRAVMGALRPGGRLVLTTPNPLAFPTLPLELIRSRRWFFTTDHAFYFLPRWVARMLERSGFVVERIVSVGLWLPFGYIPWSPISCSYQLIYVCRAA